MFVVFAILVLASIAIGAIGFLVKIGSSDRPVKIKTYDGGAYWTNSKGQYHRLDGPAIERADGTQEYWVDGKALTKIDFLTDIQGRLVTRHKSF